MLFLSTIQTPPFRSLMLSEDQSPAKRLGKDHQHNHLPDLDKPWFSMEASNGKFSEGCLLWAEFQRETQLRDLVHNQIGNFDPRRSQNKPDTDEMALAIRRILTLQKNNY